ncbi:MAG TPA: host attachment protein [Gammaproteobacteria bacterium]|nr:host attachment protein [Gammaproteobacteria bacterium]
MPAILIVAGDRGRARIFALDRDTDEMRELNDLLNPMLRLHERLLSGDRQGRGMSRFHSSRVALGKSSPHKRLSSMRFARQVAEAMNGFYNLQDYSHIYVLAEPEFVGLLRPQLAAQRLTANLHIIPKNVTRSDAATIRSHLPEHPWRRPLSGGA